jgi:hypothetical protein
LLEDVFGAGNVTVLIYRDPGPNDIVGDLLGALGTAVDRDRMTPVAAQNVSTSRRKVLFQSQMPKSRRTEEDARARALPSFVAAAVAATPAIADDGERFLMSPQQRHDLVARHLAGNRAVLARHGIVRAEAFLEPPDPDAPWSPPAPITPAELLGAWRSALAACRRDRSLPGAVRLSARVTLLFAATLLRLPGRSAAVADPGPSARRAERSGPAERSESAG